MGKVDVEHENLRYICTEGSIRIEKFETVSMSGPREVTETRTFSIEDLKRRRQSAPQLVPTTASP